MIAGALLLALGWIFGWNCAWYCAWRVSQARIDTLTEVHKHIDDVQKGKR